MTKKQHVLVSIVLLSSITISTFAAVAPGIDVTPTTSAGTDLSTYSDPDYGVCTTITGQQNITICVAPNDYATESDLIITDPSVIESISGFVSAQATAAATEETTTEEAPATEETVTSEEALIADPTDLGSESDEMPEPAVVPSYSSASLVDTSTGFDAIPSTETFYETPTNTGSYEIPSATVTDTIVDTTNVSSFEIPDAAIVDTTAPANVGVTSTCTLGDWDDMYCGGSYCTVHPEDTATCPPAIGCTMPPDWDDMYCGGSYCTVHPEDTATCPVPCTFSTWDDMTCGGPYCTVHSEDTVNCPATLIEPETSSVTPTSFTGDAAYCAVNPEDTVNCGI